MSREQELKAKGHPIFVTYKLCCITYLIVLVLIFETLLVTNPSFYIDTFNVPALNKSSNSTAITESVIFFDLIIQNRMDDVGVHYNSLNLTFSYETNTSSSMVLGTYMVPGFYQGMGKQASRSDKVIVKEAAIQALSGGSTAEFRVDVATHVKLKNRLWYFKEKTITAGGGVVVDDSGKKVGTDPVELQSREPDPSGLQVFLWIAGLLILMLVGTVMIAVGVLYFCSFFYPR